MYIIPVITNEGGSIMAAEPIPKEAIRTVITPEGCQVFMPDDSE